MIIYVKFNPARKKEYQLVTSIHKEENNLWSAKSACNHMSAAHLKTFPKAYKTLGKAGFPFVFAKPVEEDGIVKFEYSSGASLDYYLYESIRKADKLRILDIFQQSKELLSGIKVESTSLGKEFEKVFGKAQVGVQDCLPIGFIDLSLENIFYDGNKYQVVDYEWVFDFPVPLKYVYFRTVVNSYFKYAPYNIASILPLREVIDLFGITENEVESFIRYEFNFQSMVNIKEAMPDFSTYKESYYTLGQDRQSYFVESKQQEIVSLQGTVKDKESAIDDLKSEVASLKQEILSIKLTRTWRAREFLANTKRKFLRNLYGRKS